MFARFVGLFLLAVLVLVGGLLLFPAGLRNSGQVTFQGYVEGILTLVAPEVGGRIATLSVSEGDRVTAGDVLFILDSEVAESRTRQAEARLAQAKAQLRDLEAEQQRPEQIRVLEAALARAKAALAYSQAEYARRKTLFKKGVIGQAQLDAAKTAAARDKAAYEEALRRLKAAHLPARKERIAAARAAVKAAEAALLEAKIALRKHTITAPKSGQIQDIYYRKGEVVAAGQPVLALLPPENLRIRFFVPEPKLSAIHRGTRVTVTCDGCPDNLTARIRYVAREAEFTPPVIFSPEERAKLVFRVEAVPEGQAKALSPGQPVTVILDLERALAE